MSILIILRATFKKKEDLEKKGAFFKGYSNIIGGKLLKIEDLIKLESNNFMILRGLL